jgi:hypothetical protein
MEQNALLEVNSHSGSQIILQLLWKSGFHCRFRKRFVFMLRNIEMISAFLKMILPDC